jgi:hypothetical protein
MRWLTIICVASFALTNCKRESLLSSTCTDSKFTRVRFVGNVSVIVSTDRAGNYVHYIRPSNTSDLTQWGLCNMLPERFRKNGMKAKIDGYFLTYPGFELLNTGVLPFEVTRIRNK